MRFFKFKFVWEDDVAVEVEWVWVEESAVETFILFDDEDLSLDFHILDKELTMKTGDWNLRESNLSDATSLAKNSISLDKLKMLNLDIFQISSLTILPLVLLQNLC